MMNNCTFTGNVGADLKRDSFTTKDGEVVDVGEFSIAVSQKPKNGVEQTLWINCSVYGGLLKTKWMNHIVRGARVAVNGPITIDTYIHKDGSPRSSVKLRVNTVDPMQSKVDMGNDNHSAPVDPDDIPFE
tara:strand:- start:6453 stop:6842 length:390 start_codon:yes stop_codon:yes gene_type:complete